MAGPGRLPRPSGAGKRRHGGIPFHSRHRKLLITLVSVALVVGLGGTAYAYMLNAKLKNIDKVTVKLKDRPDPDKGKSLNIMLLGSDKGKNLPGESANATLAQDATAATWPSGKYRSDTLMIVHISANRKHVYLVSIPRDSFVTLYDGSGNPTHKEKVNGAFSYYGPTGAISTIEHLTNLRMSHLAIIDWAGFKELSTAVGGVPVYVPDTVYDSAQHVTWTKGNYVLKGNKALQYVRQRHGLLRGDFDRIARQQNFLRALMKKILAGGTMHNPVRLNNTLGALTKNLTVDSDWKPGDMRALALSLRGTSQKNVTFMTVPVGPGSVDPTYGDVVNIDLLKSQELFAALKDDSVETYLKKYPDAALKAPEEVH